MNCKWLWNPKKIDKGKLNIIFFPYAGGGIPSFFHWIQDLEEYANCYIVELPGRGNRFSEEPYTDITQVVYELSSNILKLKEPFIFVGHSMGALIAYELACYLQKNHAVNPVRLVVSGASSPSYPKKIQKASNLSKEAFIDRLKEINGANDEIINNNELLELVMPILRADFTLCENYIFNGQNEQLSCPITAFSGNRDKVAPIVGAEQWRELTSNTFNLKVFDGEHFFINDKYKEVLNSLIELVSYDKKRLNLNSYVTTH
ncbi:thioesterase II family protein [Priestia megaterium]|uniref:thioesterase II family protein n=1 Tax=Priestia megaterium TaxID=1404 RepID=UPI0035DFDD98